MPRLIRLMLVLVISTLLPPTPAHAVENYPPYSLGRMCYHHFWGSPNSYAAFCNNFAGAGSVIPSVQDPAAPFNTAASSAWYGYLTVGGKELMYVGTSIFYLADAATATSVMEYTSGWTQSTITATADVSDVYRYSSPYWRGLRMCLKVVDWGSPSEYGRPIGPISGGGMHCINPNTSPTRTLTQAVSIPPNRRFAIEVELDNTMNDGFASLDVYRIRCDGVCLPRTPNPSPPPGGGGGGCGSYGCY